MAFLHFSKRAQTSSRYSATAACPQALATSCGHCSPAHVDVGIETPGTCDHFTRDIASHDARDYVRLAPFLCVLMRIGLAAFACIASCVRRVAPSPTTSRRRTRWSCTAQASRPPRLHKAVIATASPRDVRDRVALGCTEALDQPRLPERRVRIKVRIMRIAAAVAGFRLVNANGKAAHRRGTSPP